MTVVHLDTIGPVDIEKVGGKAANLGLMLRAGLPVPPGFCVTTAAYDDFIRQTALWPAMQQLLSKQPVREASQKIRELIEQTPVPPPIVAEIVAAYQKLDNGQAAVAVRSSATAEDLAQASFAGQQDSFLGIRGAQSLMMHVRRCWSSLWTERAIAYRQHQGFAHDKVLLAVIVQEMVAADVAGVLFTIDPMDPGAKALIINAAYGLGESVVSGHVTPDTYRLAKKKRLRIIARSCGSKVTRIDMTALGETRQTAVLASDRRRWCLSSNDLRSLLALAHTIEAHFGAPQDVEWAIVQGQPYLLQTRPVTTLASSAAGSAKSLTRLQTAILDDILEHYPEPPYPLDLLAVTDGYQQLIDAMHACGIGMPPAGTFMRINTEGVATIDPPTPTFVRVVFKIGSALKRAMRIDPQQWNSHWLGQFQDKVQHLARTPLGPLSDDRLARFIQEAMAKANQVASIRFNDFILPAMIRSTLLNFYLKCSKAFKHLTAMGLLGDLPYKTTQIDQALRRLADQAANTPIVRTILMQHPVATQLAALDQNREAEAFREHLMRFLEEHGARTAKMYLPFSNRSWTEEPSALLSTLAILLRATGSKTAETHCFADLRDRIAADLRWFIRKCFLTTLERFRIAHIARESTLYTIEQFFMQARRGVDEAAHRMTTSGILPDPQQILFITLPELYDALHGRLDAETIRERVAKRHQARPLAQSAWRAAWRGAPSKKRRDVTPHRLTGLPGSPGVATGTAKIVTGPDAFDKLHPGDVLVCPYTDPAWTPLFTLARAIVADTGGPLSHAAIVAREYGIPAVLGTQTATSFFCDGENITVDGGRGTVSRIDPLASTP